MMLPDDTDGYYKLFLTQLQYPFALLHILQHMTQALTVQCIRLCSIILMTQNNSVPCSVGHIPEHLWGNTIKSTSHCLFKVMSGLVALLCKSPVHFCRGDKMLWPLCGTRTPLIIGYEESGMNVSDTTCCRDRQSTDIVQHVGKKPVTRFCPNRTLSEMRHENKTL
jgi:hypothetical protein